MILSAGNDYTVLVTEEDFDLRGSRGNGNANGNEILEPHCGNQESIDVTINQTGPPVTWDYRASYIFSCDC